MLTNSISSQSARDAIAQRGYAIVPGVYSADECRQLAGELDVCLAACADRATALRRSNGVIYGARNLLAIFAPALDVWRREPLLELLNEVLGPRCGLVRGLFFDKPPHNTWSLPWHQDLTIAVRDHSLPSGVFCNRTTKAGVPHVEAPDEILREMLTLRIHLDEVTAENGPLQVLPGSHTGRDATPSTCEPVAVMAQAGDVLAMRPLLAHASDGSQSGTQRHRRIIHLEFAALARLPDGYGWQWFVPV